MSLSVSLAPYLKKSWPGTAKLIGRIGQTYIDLAGYRKLGLKYDDLLIEETENMQKALSRLPAKESYDRVFRIKRGHQMSLQHNLLPRNEWIKPEEDVRYLTPLVEEIDANEAERHSLNSLMVKQG